MTARRGLPRHLQGLRGECGASHVIRWHAGNYKRSISDDYSIFKLRILELIKKEQKIIKRNKKRFRIKREMIRFYTMYLIIITVFQGLRDQRFGQRSWPNLIVSTDDESVSGVRPKTRKSKLSAAFLTIARDGAEVVRWVVRAKIINVPSMPLVLP